MFSAVQRFNTWYDQLPGTPRFLLFIGTMAAAVFPLQMGLALGHWPSAIFGFILFGLICAVGVVRAFGVPGKVHQYAAWGMVVLFSLVSLGVTIGLN